MQSRTGGQLPILLGSFDSTGAPIYRSVSSTGSTKQAPLRILDTPVQVKNTRENLEVPKGDQEIAGNRHLSQ